MDLQALRTALRQLAIYLLVVLLLQACNKAVETKVPYYNTPDLTPAWQQGAGKHTIADFSFTDQDGKTVTNDVYDGKIYVANFFFTTCPGICPKMNANMQLVADAFKDNDRVMFLSHSVTPDIDTVQQLKEYADAHHIDSKQWHLVTGNKSTIYDIARTSYFVEDAVGLSYDSTDFLHTERFVLVDKDKHIRGVYNGTVTLEMERLTDDIKLLLKE
ncbi:MAG: SCO family protein [Chitinophagaceae bacterium]|nr:SCO family protein [Chitinophagaceae bacterium]MCB9045948.1 SCO family protein [Chitinophagales bacterium]